MTCSIIILCLIYSPIYAEQTEFNKLPAADIANFLGWVNAPHKNLCGGYYQQPPIIVNYPTPGEIKKTRTTITSNHQIFYAQKGISILTGNVVVTQPGIQITADKVVLYRDPKTGKVSDADLTDHVHLREYGKLVVGNHGHIYFKTNDIVIDNGIYYLSSNSTTDQLHFWGRLKHALRDKNGVLIIHNGTYSACQPANSMWHFRSSKVRLDKKGGSGSATNTLLFIKNIPVFYTPYLWFPITPERKTGFLFPTFGHSKDSGYKLYLPFYLNLAPNYDATITPKIYSKRGILMDGIFRYLTGTSNGQLQLDYIYDDHEFVNFKNSSAKKYPPSNKYLQRLEDNGNNRAAFAFKNQSQFNEHWSNFTELNYVTDDYFMRDFGDLPSAINSDQLPNRFDLNFNDEHWRFLGRAQGFQTLHQLEDHPLYQYSRLPQLDLIGTYPDQKYGLAYQLDNEFVYFDNHKFQFATENIPQNRIPMGSRINIQPAISLPLNWGGAYIDPKLQAQGTFYSLTNQKPNLDTSISRILPIFDIDSGLIFERDLNLFSTQYTQTLEPRLFYLYAPRKNQDDIPFFDTNLSTFNFDNLFRTNRFSSVDRLGDANQFSLALTSRFLNGQSGQEKLRASIGEILAVQKHTICDQNNNCAADPLTEHKTSPLYGELKYNLTPYWSATGDMAWNINQRQINSTDLTVQYKPNNDQLFNISYNYLANGDTFKNKTINLNRIDVSTSWLVWQHWRVFGDWNYYLSYHNTQNYLYGLQYDSCCWAIRFVAARLHRGTDDFDNQFYVQFLLKGIGNIGMGGSAEGLLSQRISGYKNNFRR
jgi:LPS-assembly protein